MRWLSKRLNLPACDDLNAVGSRCRGAWSPQRETGALFSTIRGRQASRCLCARMPNPRTNRFRYAVEDGVGVFYWIDDACGYALSGRLDRGQLLAVARVVYGEIAAAEAGAPKR